MHRLPTIYGAPSTPSTSAPSPPKRVAPLSLLLLGTGGSSALPYLPCLTSPTPSGCCPACADTLPRSQGGSGRKSKNVRGNTGAVVRVPPTVEEWERGEREEKTVLIDCGKTFREQALKFFPKHGLRKIDACILTHHHADAVDGLDDLRAWTYHSAIERTIPIYTTRTTYTAIASSFPYLISKKAASGGGAVPSFSWHIMPDPEVELEERGEVQDWEVCGVRICPVPVEHGHYFNRPKGTPQRPLVSLGFLIEGEVLYISDVSRVPPPTLSLLTRRLSPSSALKALIIDSSSPLHPSASHFALPQALSLAVRLGARRTYLTDLAHGASNAMWVDVCEAVGRGRGEGMASGWDGRGSLSDEEDDGGCAGEGTDELAAFSHLFASQSLAINGPPSPSSDLPLTFHHPSSYYASLLPRALRAIEAFAPLVLDARPWVRPGVDGMVIEWGDGEGEGEVWDSEYDGAEEER